MTKQPEDKRVYLRLEATPEEHDVIRKAAVHAGFRSMAAFCRDAVVREAEHIMKQHEEQVRNEKQTK